MLPVLRAACVAGLAAAAWAQCTTRLPWSTPSASDTGCKGSSACSCANFVASCTSGSAAGLGVCDVSIAAWAVAGAIVVALIALGVLICCCCCPCCRRCCRRSESGGRVLPRGRPPSASAARDWGAGGAPKGKAAAPKAASYFQSGY